MSFINLMANDVWSEADITRRTEAMIRSEFPIEDETILNRKAVGSTLGTYTPTLEEQIDMAHYAAVAQAAQAEGEAARADMALLNQVLAMEEAQRRLDQPLPPDDAAPEDLRKDTDERAAAQAIIDGASPQARELFDKRQAAQIPSS